VCSLQLIRNLFILTRSCNKGGCFLCSSSAKKCVAVATSLVYTTTHAPAVLRWAGRSGSQVKGALALPSAVRLAIAFFFSPPMIRKRTRRRPVPFTSPSRSSGWTERGRGRRHCRARPAPCRSNQRLFSPPPNDSLLLPGTLARRNDCERLISGVLTAVRPW